LKLSFEMRVLIWSILWLTCYAINSYAGEAEPQRQFLDYLRGVNERHLAERQGESDLAARIATYELAARMQTSAKEALDLNQETARVV
jgi:Protein of unknown function (DUF1501)